MEYTDWPDLFSVLCLKLRGATSRKMKKGPTKEQTPPKTKKLAALPARLIREISGRIAEQYYEANAFEINKMLVDLHSKLNPDNDENHNAYVKKMMKTDYVHNLDQIRRYFAMVRGGLKLAVRARYDDKRLLGSARDGYSPCRIDLVERVAIFFVETKGDRVTETRGEKVSLPLSSEIVERFRVMKDHHVSNDTGGFVFTNTHDKPFSSASNFTRYCASNETKMGMW